MKLLVTPSLGYAPGQNNPDHSEASNQGNPDKFRLKGDLTVFVNDTRVAGKFEHDFGSEDNIYGIAIWCGNLSDVKLVEY